MVVGLILGKKKRITNKNKTMPYNNSPAKKYGALHMDHGPKMMGKTRQIAEPAVLKMCGSKRHMGKKK